MVDEKKLRDLIDKGVVLTDSQGLRVIDASRQRNPKERRRRKDCSLLK
jgi:hypothetical protein